MSSNEFEQLVAAIADGKDVDLTGLSPGQHTTGLMRLQQLSKAFKHTPTDRPQDDRPTLFQWRHLAVKAAVGAGAFGQIYRAYDPLLRRDVALKLGKEGSHHGAVGNVVVTEARRMARLRHPNILAVHGADEDNHRVGIWSDFLEGKTLDQVLKDAHQLQPQAVLQLAVPLADALTLIHSRALTHGDFKLVNIMVQPDGSPVVMDFGASRDLGGGAATVGSPLIMAPELFDEGIGTAASDIYAFGVLLFQLLSGQYPIDAQSLDELQQRHRERTPIRFGLLPRAWRPLIASMLSVDPKKRPDAPSVLAQLQFMRSARQRLLKRLAVAAVIGSLALGLIVSTLANRETTRQRDRAESTTNTLLEILQSPRPSRSGRALRVLDLLRDFRPQLDQVLIAQPESRARVLLELAKTFLYFDDFDAAQQLSDQALAACSACDESDRALVEIRRHHILGEIDQIKLQLDDALTHVRAALNTAEQHLPIHSTERIYAMAWVGSVLNAQRKLEDARPYLQEAVQRAATVPWADNTQLAFVRGRWVNNLLAREDYDEAMVQARALSDWAEKTLGLRHNSTLSAHQSLVQVLIRTGQTDEAESRVQADIAMANDWLGPADSTTVGLRLLMAVTISRQGRLAESIAQHEQIRTDILASSEPDQEALLVVTGNLASRYKQDQQYDAAQSLYQSVIEQAQAALGPEHPRVLLNRGNLAELYLLLKQNDRALSLAAEVEQVAARTLGNGHSITNFARLVQGRGHVAKKQWSLALPKLEQAASEFLQTLGPDAALTMESQFHLAKALAAAGDSTQALALARALLPRNEKVLGADHDNTREVRAFYQELAGSTAAE